MQDVPNVGNWSWGKWEFTVLSSECFCASKTILIRNLFSGTSLVVPWLRICAARQSGWLLSKSLQAINAGEGVEKREPSYTVGGNAN